MAAPCVGTCCGGRCAQAPLKRSSSSPGLSVARSCSRGLSGAAACQAGVPQWGRGFRVSLVAFVPLGKGCTSLSSTWVPHSTWVSILIKLSWFKACDNTFCSRFCSREQGLQLPPGAGTPPGGTRGALLGCSVTWGAATPLLLQVSLLQVSLLLQAPKPHCKGFFASSWCGAGCVSPGTCWPHGAARAQGHGVAPQSPGRLHPARYFSANTAK